MTLTVDAGRRHQQSQESGRSQDGSAAGAAVANKWIGQSVTRLEDPPLVRGHGRFAGDISFAQQLHMRLVRANHAHGKIVAIGPMRELLQSEHPWVRAYFHGKRSQMLQPIAS